MYGIANYIDRKKILMLALGTISICGLIFWKADKCPFAIARKEILHFTAGYYPSEKIVLFPKYNICDGVLMPALRHDHRLDKTFKRCISIY